MIYLIIALIATCIISIGFKLVTIYQADMDWVITVNYAVALVITGFVAAWTDQMGTEYGKGMFPLAALLGAAMIFNLRCTKKSTDENGMGSTTFFNRIGFLLCMALSALVWREVPNGIQILGIVILLAALIEMMRGVDDGKAAGSIKMFAWLFLGSGLVSFFNVAYGRYFPAKAQPFFLAEVFAVTFLSSLLLLSRKARQKKGNRKTDIALGLLVGTANAATTFFTLKSLEYLSAAVVMPVTAAGNLLIIAITGRIVFHEKGNRHITVALVCAVISLVLVNM